MTYQEKKDRKKLWEEYLKECEAEMLEERRLNKIIKESNGESNEKI